jgi:hypothetical protein
VESSGKYIYNMYIHMYTSAYLYNMYTQRYMYICVFLFIYLLSGAQEEELEVFNAFKQHILVIFYAPDEDWYGPCPHYDFSI